MSSRFLLRLVLVVVGLVLFTSCSLAEPITIAGLTLQEQTQKLPQDKVEPICKALENAGYVMPYGPALPWDFEITQSKWILSGSDGVPLAVSYREPSIYIIVDWHIPADLNKLPDAVSQDTVDQLAGEAKKVCRIVQQEARNQGIGPVRVVVRLWDLIVGTEIEYGHRDPRGYPQFTGDCDQFTGAYAGKSIGLNPSEPMPGHCPSLYVSADTISPIRLDIDGTRGGQNIRP